MAKHHDHGTTAALSIIGIVILVFLFINQPVSKDLVGEALRTLYTEQEVGRSCTIPFEGMILTEDHADDGTILICPGDYNFGLSLEGANLDCANSNFVGSLIISSQYDIEVENCNFESLENALYIEDSNNINFVSNSFYGINGVHIINSQVTFSNNIITGDNYGVYLLDSTGSSFSENNIYGYYGIRAVNSVSLDIANNFIDGITQGIRLENSPSLISENTIDGNYFGVQAIDSSSVISDNTITSNTHGIKLYSSPNSEIQENYISGGAHNGVRIEYSEETTVSSNTIDFSIGVSIFNSRQSVISGNTMTGEYGVSTEGTTFNNDLIIQDNSISALVTGISLVSNNNNVIGNTISNSEERGIELFKSSDNIIENNHISLASIIDDSVGIYLYCDSNLCSDYNEIKDNTVYFYYKGVFIDSGDYLTTGGSIEENNLYNNNIGLDLIGAWDISVNQNMICSNAAKDIQCDDNPNIGFVNNGCGLNKVSESCGISSCVRCVGVFSKDDNVRVEGSSTE